MPNPDVKKTTRLVKVKSALLQAQALSSVHRAQISYLKDPVSTESLL